MSVRTPLFEKPFVWTDVESTGLCPVKNDIISLAIVRPLIKGGEAIYQRKLKLVPGRDVSPKALEINHYTEEDWADAKDPKEVFQEIADLKLFDDCIIAGQNVRFDVGMFEESFKRYGIKYRIGYHLYDTVTLALLVLKPYLTSVSLVPVCVALGIPFNGAHDALVDLRMAQQVDVEIKRLLHTGDWQKADFGGKVQSRILQWEQQGKPNQWPLEVIL